MEKFFHKPNKTQLIGASLVGVGLWTGGNTAYDILFQPDSSKDTTTLVIGSSFWLGMGSGILALEKIGMFKTSLTEQDQKPQKSIEESLESFIDFHKMVASENYHQLQSGIEYPLANLVRQSHLNGLLPTF